MPQCDTLSPPPAKGKNKGLAPGAETPTTLAHALATDYTIAPIEPADRVMLDYTAKLTRTPAAMKEDDVAALRRAGFSDAAVLDICQVTAYFAFVNRLADGLGVELEG